MSEVGKIPNPLNPANDPKKDKHRLGSNQFREKFDYRKKEETSSNKITTITTIRQGRGTTSPPLLPICSKLYLIKGWVTLTARVTSLTH